MAALLVGIKKIENQNNSFNSDLVAKIKFQGLKHLQKNFD